VAPVQQPEKAARRRSRNAETPSLKSLVAAHAKNASRSESSCCGNALSNEARISFLILPNAMVGPVANRLATANASVSWDCSGTIQLPIPHASACSTSNESLSNAVCAADADDSGECPRSSEIATRAHVRISQIEVCPLRRQELNPHSALCLGLPPQPLRAVRRSPALCKYSLFFLDCLSSYPTISRLIVFVTFRKMEMPRPRGKAL
jgi:hypothetical protein